jgi:putative ABC transport system permease protein
LVSRAAVAAASPDLSVNDVQSMRQIVDDQLTGDRFSMVLLGGFAGIALLLAALGLYGVMSFVVAQRTREVRLRKALGAQKNEVITLMVRSGIKRALPGVAIGMAGVYVLGRLMQSTLYGVDSVDYFSAAVVAALLLAVAVFACWVPPRRSAHVDPIVALRQE